MKINDRDLIRAAAKTRNWPGCFGIHTDIHYDRATGHVWANTEIGDNCCTLPESPEEMIVAKTVSRTSAAEILQAIQQAVVMDARCRKYLEAK